MLLYPLYCLVSSFSLVPSYDIVGILFQICPCFFYLQHAALPDLDDCTSFFGVYDGHGGKFESSSNNLICLF